MSNVKAQSSNEIQMSNDRKSFAILSFDIPLTFEICHLDLYLQVCFTSLTLVSCIKKSE
jgi:hypothetical protein